MTLENFPRGGKKPVTKSNLVHSFGKKDVFTKRPKKRSKKSDEAKLPKSEENYIPNTAECLTYSNIAEGMVLLGRIQSTTEYELIVSLPGRLTGRVQATDVSGAYTNLLRSLVNSDEEKIEEFKPLSELYSCGKYVVCYVKSIHVEEKWKVSLSLEPELINRNLDPTKLRKGSKIIGTVSAVEEHGYVIDTGIDNFRCFLSMKDIDEDAKYYPGKQLFCAIRKSITDESSTTSQVTTKRKHVGSVLCSDERSLDALLPGTQFLLIVEKILSNGIQISFNNKSVGYVNRMYLEEPLQSYKIGQEFVGVLMYVMPMVKFAYFTLLSSDEDKECLDVGDVFEKARVSFIGSKSIVVSLKKGIRGVIPFRRTEVAPEKIASKYTPGSTHKCRVLAYDLFEQSYVCTTERKLLEENLFSSSSLKPGDRLKVEIVRIQEETENLMVRAGRITGWVLPEHTRDPQEKKIKVKVGDTIEARFLGRDRRGKGVLFTLKKSLIESTLPILHDIAEAKIGGKYHGTIVQITKKGILVRFYDQLKGWIPSRALNEKESSANWNFLVGQVVAVTVEKIDRKEGEVILGVSKDENDDEEKREDEPTTFEVGENVEGVVVDVSVEGIYLRIARGSEDDAMIGFLPTGHLSPCEEIGSYFAARCALGETISALVFSTKPRFLLSRTFVSRPEQRDWKRLRAGDCLPCSIHEINDDGLKLVMPIDNFGEYGFVPRSEIQHNDSLRPSQILFATITSIDRKSRKIRLTTSLPRVWNSSSTRDSDLMASVDVLSLYLSKLQELREQDYYREKSISKAKIGSRVKGVVEKVTDHGLVLRLENELTGTVRMDHFEKKVKVGDTVNGTIIWVNYIHELVEVTLLPKFVNAISTKQNYSDLPNESQFRSDIVLVTSWLVLVVLKGPGKGMLAALPARRHLNDVEPDLSPYSLGKRIRCYVVLNRSETGFLPICLIKSAFELPRVIESSVRNLKRKSERESLGDDAKKTKMTNGETESVDSKPPKKKVSEIQGTSTVAREEEPKRQKSREKKVNEVPEIQVDTATVEKAEKAKRKREKNKARAKRKKSKEENKPETTSMQEVNDYSDSDEENAAGESAIPESGFFWDNERDESLVEKRMTSSSSEEEDEEESSQRKKKKKASAAERREAERLREREIREREEALARNEAPNSVDQFDRLVLASPDNSLIWLRYMAYHLQATEIEKARAVAKRAIKTINFREESERLNVWQAWLNLESRFGSPESLESVFQEAVKTNDPLSIYLHMLTVHADSGNQAGLEKLVGTVLGKFKQLPRVWHECGAAFLKIGLRDKSRHVMQRAIQSLPPQQHVNMMVKFAQLENKFGDKERAETLFEQILSSYPKRVDVWSSYVDALIKSGNVNNARKVLEKAVLQTLPARKMKTLFKKFIDFEQKHGTPEGVARVQELAVKYVEKECNNTVEM